MELVYNLVLWYLLIAAIAAIVFMSLSLLGPIDWEKDHREKETYWDMTLASILLGLFWPLTALMFFRDTVGIIKWCQMCPDEEEEEED